ncbi:S41 family peptidase [Glaciecola sp. SC05]|uniref:S41 family peptidase n=1 Tax=Glaciecola sp. SC05 TaxID=1987355 RepID=UPI0035290196
MNLALRSYCLKSLGDKIGLRFLDSLKRGSAKRKLASLLAFVALFSSADALAQANTAYFTEPTLHDNTLVFASQGDLWIADVSTDNEQMAVRLSSHINVESQPHISPDGNSLAFVSDYASVPSVYVMPSIGGTPRQVSFELMPSKLLGWVDNTTLLYSTMSATGMHNSYELKTLNLSDLNTSTLPLSDAVQGTISEDGSTVFFIQFGLQISSDNANQYRGGASGELWSYDLASKREARHLSVTHSGSVSYPMLYQDRLFFVSNQSGLDNIWSMNKNGDDFRQHTNFTDWAVRSPSVSNNSIVFQHGADLKQLHLATDEVSTYSILLQSDNTLLRTHYINNPLEYLENISIGHNGKKVVLTARGRIAVAHTDTTRLMNITTDPTSRSRHGILSKDGKHIYAISDVSGEYEIWQFDGRGKDTPKQLTDDGSILRTGLWLSPSGELLAHTDKSGKVFLLDLSSGKNRLIMDAKAQNSITDLVFSPDSQFLSFAYQARTSERAQIYLRDIKSGKNKLLTSTKYHAYSPTFSSNSQWLYFLSDRSFTPTPGSPWGDRNMGQMLDKRGQIFAISLGTNSSFPFAAPNELDTPIADDADENDTPAKIDFENIETRLWQVDAPSGNYQNLIATESHLFLLERDDSRSSDLKAIEFGFGNKLKNVTGGVNNIAISGDGKQLLVQKGTDENAKLFVIPASASFPDDTDDVSVKLTNWSLAITPEDEWQQIFKDAWLMHRDSLFDANMRGIDWQASKQKYMPLLSRVSARHELNDIFEQMMGELNALHSQVRGGDISNDMNAPAPASLGAAYLDDKNGVKIARIYQFDREQLSQAPPLAMPGVNAQNGDIITAINGKSIKNTAELHSALLNSAGAQVLLDLKRGRKSHQTIVVPASYQTEARYRYQDWVITNLNKVIQINSDIGYLHLYAMGANDIASFAREFYAQYEKPGLIIDVRRNRGGNIDSVIIEKLMRRAWSFWQSTDGGKSTNMQQAFRGHLVVLADQFTYSDGETFTAGIRALDLGTVIGKQTAGAGVWLSGGNRVVDGGIARVAEFPVYAMDGRWITEGRGISPDIEVTNLPSATFNGEDAQLMAAIEYLQNKLVSEPVNDYKALPFPSVETPAHDIK